MRGVLLTGGTGSRLMPLTEVTNKHLLPIGNKPMLEWPLRNLIACGCREIMVITGKEHAGSIFQYLGSGSKWGVDFTFRVQDKPAGIAHALYLARDFCESDSLSSVMMMLGDNIFEEDLSEYGKIFTFGQDFKQNAWNKYTKFMRKNDGDAMILVKEVEDPERFGVVEVLNDRVVGIEEKPKKPKSNLIQTGAYFYDINAFEYIEALKPSDRGELEITALNMEYVKRGKMSYRRVKGWWTDAGTLDTLHKANELAGLRKTT